MCKAVITASKSQDRSPSLLATLTSSLSASFSPSEIVTAGGKQACAEALQIITALTKSGYIQGSKQTTQSVAELISSYTVRSNTFGSSTGVDGIPTEVYPVNEAVSLRGIRDLVPCICSWYSLITSYYLLPLNAALKICSLLYSLLFIFLMYLHHYHSLRLAA